MTEQQYDNLKENYLKHIKRYMKEAGGLFPHITILADHLNETEDPKSAVIHIPIPDEYMENDEAKDEFISMTSHQLRTPLTSVKGYIDMVLDGDAGPVNDSQRQLLSRAAH
mgnify:CR=1 FL=1